MIRGFPVDESVSRCRSADTTTDSSEPESPQAEVDVVAAQDFSGNWLKTSTLTTVGSQSTGSRRRASPSLAGIVDHKPQHSVPKDFATFLRSAKSVQLGAELDILVPQQA